MINQWPMFRGTHAAILLALVVSVGAQCPIVKTEMESWDLSVWNGVSVVFHNQTAAETWNVTMCDLVSSQIYDWGNFQGGEGSVQFHEPSDTFYMLYENGDRGEDCMNDPRQTDVYVHCQGCPPHLGQCVENTVPCICAAWEDGCVAEVHIHDVCPVGQPKYRVGFDVYDASTGIEADVSKVVVKDGEVLPAWRDESTPEVKASRAVIPHTVPKALFYLMMSEGSTENTEFDAPDVFTDQPSILQITVDGSGANGGTVTPSQMQTVELHFHCLMKGLADVHLEISFGGKFYPSDFAFTYECVGAHSSAGSAGGVLGFMIIGLIIFGCVGGAGYNMKTHGKQGIDALPGIEIWQPILVQAKEGAVALFGKASDKLNEARAGGVGGGMGGGGSGYTAVGGDDEPVKGFQEEDESFGII